MKVLITSGGCKVLIDDVRHIGNFSSGRYGMELARAFLEAGHEVFLVREKGSAAPTEEEMNWCADRFQTVEYTDYYSYKLVSKATICYWNPDMIISAAAISDYVLEKTSGKISSDGNTLTLTLTKGEKVIESFQKLANPDTIIVGCKLLVDADEDKKNKAVTKLLNSGVDYVLYNDLSELRKGNDRREIFSLSYASAVSVGKMNVSETVDFLSKAI
jgi:phosphopantothenoylcysteine synthetase/decarboxylase